MSRLSDEELEELAEALHRAFRKLHDLAPPWNGVHPRLHDKVVAGIRKIYEPDWFYDEDDSG